LCDKIDSKGGFGEGMRHLRKIAHRVGTGEEVQHFQDACVGVDVVVWEFLADGLDRRAEIPPPFVGRCTFDLAEEEKTTLGRIDDEAEVFELAGLGVEGIVVDLDFGLEIEGEIEEVEGLAWVASAVGRSAP
jgi:hypothetical protein